MLDSIYIGMSGLQGYSKGLRVIANNTANINTPGFKSSTLQFGDMFYSGGGHGGLMSGSKDQAGHGLLTNGTTLNFKQGELRQTGNALDLSVDGEGLFTLKDANGGLHYTRAGQFEFNTDGILVNRADGSKVMGRADNGGLSEITISGSRTNGGKASAVVKFIGNIPSTSTSQTVSGVKVIDGAGGEHTLTLSLTNVSVAGSTDVLWKVDVLDGATNVGTGQVKFVDGKPTAGTAKIAINYTPAGLTAVPFQLDFSTDVTSFASGSLSTLAFSSQDGYSPGTLTNATFDAAGTLVLTYSNGKTSKGPKLNLGKFDSIDAVEAAGNNQFDVTDASAWRAGVGGVNGFGAIKSGMVEISNVDLSQEFSDLVIMQRGYQASSQIITTANEMLQELFSMKGK